ncbi:MAG TPA: hypothetical protein VFR90_17290 [Methylibium sp.]|uniref:hypothetical protein n=1 Tax=Methylibium sp. TaxID=2067992 RepID=UPI002DBD1321|nr:hypothetical protein [Methylibium sp.]HEU4460879.1 hypothetical protein [Methylibium sp.]
MSGAPLLVPATDPLLRPQPVVTVVGTVTHCKLAWAGQFDCTLLTDKGVVRCVGNREQLLDANAGDRYAFSLRVGTRNVVVEAHRLGGEAPVSALPARVAHD